MTIALVVVLPLLVAVSIQSSIAKGGLDLTPWIPSLLGLLCVLLLGEVVVQPQSHITSLGEDLGLAAMTVLGAGVVVLLAAIVRALRGTPMGPTPAAVLVTAQVGLALQLVAAGFLTALSSTAVQQMIGRAETSRLVIWTRWTVIAAAVIVAFGIVYHIRVQSNKALPADCEGRT